MGVFSVLCSKQKNGGAVGERRGGFCPSVCVCVYIYGSLTGTGALKQPPSLMDH